MADFVEIGVDPCERDVDEGDIMQGESCPEKKQYMVCFLAIFMFFDHALPYGSICTMDVLDIREVDIICNCKMVKCDAGKFLRVTCDEKT